MYKCCLTRSGDREMFGKMLSKKSASPLLFNGYALVANAGVSSILGVVFWMLATRLYSQDQVGLGAALISTMMTISYLSQMNLSTLLVRFLPLSGAGAGRLIFKTYVVSGVVAAIAALCFALSVGWFSEPLEILNDDPVTTALFVLATVIWSWFALQDAVLSGLRRSILVPVKNFVYSILKIAFLIGLAFAVLPTARMLFLAWVVPLVPIVVAVNYQIFRKLLATDQRFFQGTEPQPRDLLRFLGWDSIGTFSLAAAFGLAPVMVTASAGVESNASYHLAWTLAYSVYLVGRSMSTSLIAEGAAQPARLRTLASDTLCHALVMVCGAVLVVVAGAPLIMALFGPAYVAEGATILRLLTLSCIPWAVTTVYISAARARGRTRTVAFVQLATLIVFAAASYPLVSNMGAHGVASAWLIAHSLVCLFVIAMEIRKGGRDAVIDWTLALAGSAARMVAGVRKSLTRSGSEEEIEVRRVLDEMHEVNVGPVSMNVVAGSLSDVTSVMLESEGVRSNGAEDVSRHVLKFGRSKNGIKALRRNAKSLRQLSDDERIESFRHILPRIEAFYDREGLACSIETAVTGIEAQSFLKDEKNLSAAAVAATAVMHDLHQRTASDIVIDQTWLARWVDTPIRSMATCKSTYWPGLNREAALEDVRQALGRVLLGRNLSLGLGHGDLWFGNIFFADAKGTSRDVVVSGLIDWDTARSDAPPGWDASHLAIAVRVQKSREELGSVVAERLQDGGWSREEQEIFAKAGVGAWLNNDSELEYQWAMLVLMWLHHVAAGVEKSDRKSNNPLWVAANVDRVLAKISQVTPWCRHA
jgi:O-antigen/teichoic acid export membrane protein